MANFILRETGAQIQNLLSGIRGMTGVLQRGGETVYRAATATDLRAVGYTPQTLSEQQKAQARENIGVGAEGGGVFVATYGTTTSAEIEAAYQAGKNVLCRNGNYTAVLLARRSASSYSFGTVTFASNNRIMSYRFNCESDTWSTVQTSSPDSSNQVTSISESSTNLQFPSAKAVYDFAPVLTAPDGSKWQLNVSNSGAVSSTKVT